jgi:hypothetical protein
MLRVTVELFPFGDENYKKVITIFDIANDGTGTCDNGNYKIRTSPSGEWFDKVVTNYPRQSDNVRTLVYQALDGLKKLNKL